MPLAGWRAALVRLVPLVAATAAFAQGAPQRSPGTLAFEVVSIKRNVAVGSTSALMARPDGGVTAINVPVTTLLARAYPPIIPFDMIGLPDWASSDRYDVSAIGSLTRATPDEQAAMMRAMLADRFRLVARLEQREQQVYLLVRASSGGALGPGLKPSSVDCVDRAAAQRKALAEREAAGRNAASAAPGDVVAAVGVAGGAVVDLPCVMRMSGDTMTGDITMDDLVPMLRSATRRPVLNRTGLEGTWHVTATFDRFAGLRGPEVVTPDDAAPSVFDAVQRQLGLKLEAARAPIDVLVIERLQRPTEN